MWRPVWPSVPMGVPKKMRYWREGKEIGGQICENLCGSLMRVRLCEAPTSVMDAWMMNIEPIAPSEGGRREKVIMSETVR